VKDADFQLLVTSVRQAGVIRRGKMEPKRKIEVRAEDVKAIRSKLQKSQSEFALMIGVSVATLQNWEQGRRQPEGPARALLKVASVNPSAVAAALDFDQKSTVALVEPRRR
jgi:putative transcriptional regulator